MEKNMEHYMAIGFIQVIPKRMNPDVLFNDGTSIRLLKPPNKGVINSGPYMMCPCFRSSL